MATKWLVIDVSKYQEDIDFIKVKNAGVKGVIIRQGYRGYGSAGNIVTDPYFEKNVKGCVNAGLPFGLYFFSQAINSAEAIEEANYCIDAIEKLGYKPEFPIYIDTELANNGNGRADNLSKLVRTNVVKAFCERVEARGYFAGIYASTSWFNTKLNDAELSAYSHWVAHYAWRCGYTKDYAMWQYSSTARIKGILGNVDVNYCYVDFPSLIKKLGLNGHKIKTYKINTAKMTEGDKKVICDKLDKLKIGYTVVEA